MNYSVENACNYIHMYHFNRQINVVIVDAHQYITPVILLILYHKPKMGPPGQNNLDNRLHSHKYDKKFNAYVVFNFVLMAHQINTEL